VAVGDESPLAAPRSDYAATLRSPQGATGSSTRWRRRHPEEDHQGPEEVFKADGVGPAGS
jgi:hypothetical protein